MESEAAEQVNGDAIRDRQVNLEAAARAELVTSTTGASAAPLDADARAAWRAMEMAGSAGYASTSGESGHAFNPGIVASRIAVKTSSIALARTLYRPWRARDRRHQCARDVSGLGVGSRHLKGPFNLFR